MNTIEKIVNLIKERGMQQKEFTKKIEIRESAVSDWKRGYYKPTAEIILKIADYFGVTTDYLLRDGEQNKFDLIKTEENKVTKKDLEKLAKEKLIDFMNYIFDSIRATRRCSDKEVGEFIENRGWSLTINDIAVFKSGEKIHDIDEFKKLKNLVGLNNMTEIEDYKEKALSKYTEAEDAIFNYISKPYDEEIMVNSASSIEEADQPPA